MKEKEFLKENFGDFILMLDIMCVRHEDSLSELKDEIKRELATLRDQTHDMLGRVNLLDYDISHSEEDASSETKNGEIKWKVPITNIRVQLW